MRTFLKFALGAVGVVALLLVVAIVAFALLFDADRYKATVQTLVKNQTGRDLAITGDLSVTYFPWLGFEVGPTTLADGPGYGDQPFARFEAASARVRLIPLLKKQVEIGALSLEGLDLKLVRNKDGTANWDDLASSDEAPADKAAAQQDSPLSALRIGGVRLVDADVSFQDKAEGATYTITDWNLTTGELTPGAPFEFETRLAVSASAPQIAGNIEAAGTLTTDIDAGRYTLATPDMKIDLTGKDLPAGSIAMDLDGETLTMEGEDLTLIAAKIKMRLAGGDLPVDTLNVSLATPRITMAGQLLTVESPQMDFDGSGSGDKPFTRLDGNLKSGAIRLTNNDAYEIPGLDLNLNAGGPSFPDSGIKASVTAQRVAGSVARDTVDISDIVLKGMGLAMTLPKISGAALSKTPRFTGQFDVAKFSPRDLARELKIELPPTADGSVFASANASAGFVASDTFMRLSNLKMALDQTNLSGSFSVENFDTQAMRFDLAVDSINADRYLPPPEEPDESRPVDALEIPSEQIRALNAEGTLKIGKLVFAGIQSTDVVVGMKAQDGSVRVFPSRANLYGGTYSGDIGIDASGPKPRMSINEQLIDVKFGELTRDMFESDKLTGTVSGRVTLTAVGDEITELRQTLNGDAQFRFADGAYEGVDLWHEISKGVALFQKQPVPSGAGAGRTVFSDMSGTATVTDGVMYSDDLAVSLPFMRVGGKGTINVVTQQIDYQVNATIVKTPQISAEAGKLAGRTVPVSITGPLDSPKIRPDVQAMLAGAVKDKVQEKIDEKLGGVLGGLLGGRQGASEQPAAETGAAKDTTAEAPKEARPEDLLRGLLGGSKPAAEAKPAEDGATAEGEAEQPAAEEKQEERRPRDLLKDLLGGG